LNVSNEQDLKVILQNNLSTFVRFYTILRCRSVQLQRCINNEETNKCTLTLSILLSNLFLDRERNIFTYTGILAVFMKYGNLIGRTNRLDTKATKNEWL